MRLRGMVVLIALAALAGTPSPASAANNTLLAPAATPVGGAVLLSVRYEGKFEATTVTATIAGLPLPMVLASGTARSGTWVLSTVLLSGSHTVSFSATVERGGSPVLDWGASFTASSPPPTPAPAGTPHVSPNAGDAPDAPEPGAPGAAEATAPPGTSAAPAAGPSAAIPGMTPAIDPPSGEAAPSEAVPVGAGSDEGGEVVANAPAAPAEPTVAAGRDGPRGSGQPGGVLVEDETDEPQSDEDVLSELPRNDFVRGVLLVGLAGVAAIALIGSALLLAGRRRRPSEEPAVTQDATAAVLEQRTLRRGRVRLQDDPIVAALGVGRDARPRRPRRRTLQVNEGPGERTIPPQGRARAGGSEGREG